MTTNSITIITDSTCDIPAELVEQYHIIILPHYVIWGNEQFQDRITIQPEEFYERLQRDPIYPSSAHVTELEYLAAFEAAHTAGATEVVVVTISGAMSGAVNVARKAAEQASLPVHIVDARGPTMSVGWQVLAAARTRENGASAAEMVAAADKARGTMVQLVCMESLEYLHKGGRIGNATHLIGSVLNIKPVIWIDHLSGLVETAGIARTHKSAVELMYKKFFSMLDTTKPIRIAVLHGGVLEEAQALAKRILADYNPVELIINITGPVLGINTGPRALALCGYSE